MRLESYHFICYRACPPLRWQRTFSASEKGGSMVYNSSDSYDGEAVESLAQERRSLSCYRRKQIMQLGAREREVIKERE